MIGGRRRTYILDFLRNEIYKLRKKIYLLFLPNGLGELRVRVFLVDDLGDAARQSSTLHLRAPRIPECGINVRGEHN